VARNNGDDRQIATLLQRMARLCGCRKMPMAF